MQDWPGILSTAQAPGTAIRLITPIFLINPTNPTSPADPALIPVADVRLHPNPLGVPVKRKQALHHLQRGAASIEEPRKPADSECPDHNNPNDSHLANTPEKRYVPHAHGQQVEEEDWAVVQQHLLVVQGQAEEDGTQEMASVGETRHGKK